MRDILKDLAATKDNPRWNNIIKRENRGLSGKNRKSMSRTNSTNKVNLRPNSEYIFNKAKSISLYNQN